MDLNDYFIVLAMLILVSGILYASITNAMFKMRRDLMDELRKLEVETMRLQKQNEQEFRDVRDDIFKKTNNIESNLDRRITDVYSQFSTLENTYNQNIEDFREELNSRCENMYRIVNKQSLIDELENNKEKKSIREMVEKYI